MSKDPFDPAELRVLGTAEAAEYLGVAVVTLARNWREWGLQPFRVGRQLQYRQADLDEWLESRREPVREAQ
jgi:excisionase family DNA binding protein